MKKEKSKTRNPAENKTIARKSCAPKKSKKSVPMESKTKAKPKAARKERSDGVAAALKIARAVTREIKPPEYIRFKTARDYQFFDSIISELAKADWSDHSIEIAAILARTMSDLETEQHTMRREGGIRKGLLNPRKSLIDMHTKNILQMRRSLSLHARALEGEGRNIGKSRAAAKELENSLTADDDDDLLARPSTMQ